MLQWLLRGLKRLLVRLQGFDPNQPIPLLQLLHIAEGQKIIAFSVAVSGPALLFRNDFIRILKRELLDRCIYGTQFYISANNCLAVLGVPMLDNLALDSAVRMAAESARLELGYAPTIQASEAPETLTYITLRRDHGR